MRRELGEHAHERGRDRLAGNVRGRTHHIDHRVDGEPVRCVQREREPLCRIAAHGEQPLQRLRLHLADESRNAIAERGRYALLVRVELVGDLEHVADDDLVVGGVVLVLVDGARDGRRIGRRQLGGCVASGAARASRSRASRARARRARVLALEAASSSPSLMSSS